MFYDALRCSTMFCDGTAIRHFYSIQKACEEWKYYFRRGRGPYNVGHISKRENALRPLVFLFLKNYLKLFNGIPAWHSQMKRPITSGSFLKKVGATKLLCFADVSCWCSEFWNRKDYQKKLQIRQVPFGFVPVKLTERDEPQLINYQSIRLSARPPYLLVRNFKKSFDKI